MLKVCLGIAIGAEGRSEVAVAAEFGVKRATISKRARRFVQVLNLVPGRGMRRPEAVEEYRDRQNRIWEESGVADQASNFMLFSATLRG